MSQVSGSAGLELSWGYPRRVPRWSAERRARPKRKRRRKRSRSRGRGARERSTENERHGRICLQIKEGRRSAGRRHCLASRIAHEDVATRLRFGCGARHERLGCPSGPLRARTPLGAPPRHSPGASPSSAPVRRFLRLGSSGVTRFGLSAVYRAPRGPVVVPVGPGPRAARERLARPRAGTAPTPPSGSHPECAFDGRASSANYRNSHRSQFPFARDFVQAVTHGKRSAFQSGGRRRTTAPSGARRRDSVHSQ